MKSLSLPGAIGASAPGRGAGRNDRPDATFVIRALWGRRAACAYDPCPLPHARRASGCKERCLSLPSLPIGWRRPRRALWATALALALPVALLGACSSTPKPPPPQPVVGSITSSAQLNPSVNKRPSPLMLRVYELKSAAVFQSSDFMGLFQGDQGTLAADMVSREEMILQPGESRPYKKTLAPETRFLAVLGAYRDLERAVWRAVVPVPSAGGKPQAVEIRADELAVSVTIKPPR